MQIGKKCQKKLYIYSRIMIPAHESWPTLRNRNNTTTNTNAKKFESSLIVKAEK